MGKQKYTKQALTYSAQLAQLKSRGLQISDDNRALHLLEQISYYRLSAYWFPLLTLPKDQHIFKPGSTLNQAFELYCFDRELRQLLSAQLEKIEIAVRAKLIYVYSNQYGPFWLSDSSLFISSDRFAKTSQKLYGEYDRSDEEFLRAFKRNYSDEMPPSWMVLEVSTFGVISSIFMNLKATKFKRKIARHFGVDDKTFASWLHALSYIRNLCAHHSRLWNRELRIQPSIPDNPNRTFLTSQDTSSQSNRKVYVIAAMVKYLLDAIHPKHTFPTLLEQLFLKYPNTDIQAMGFPHNWTTHTLWST